MKNLVESLQEEGFVAFEHISAAFSASFWGGGDWRLSGGGSEGAAVGLQAIVQEFPGVVSAELLECWIFGNTLK